MSRVELDRGKFASTYYKKLASAGIELSSASFKHDALTDCAKARRWEDKEKLYTMTHTFFPVAKVDVLGCVVGFLKVGIVCL